LLEVARASGKQQHARLGIELRHGKMK
jgi:hypothetical protein